MRFRCSSSVVALALLAGCGGGRPAAHDPFAYDGSRPLAIQQAGVVASGPKAVAYSLSYAGVNGTRVNAFLLVPTSRGRHAAVLLLHGSGGTREDLLPTAARLAVRGAVTMTISQPNDAPTYRPLVVNARRALDLLDARRDVDPRRLALVGFSLGGQTAAILAGDEPRLRVVGILSGYGSDAAVYWIRRTHAHLFFEAGTRDALVSHAGLLRLMRAAPDHPRVRWYDTGHGMSVRAVAAMNAWLASRLGLR